MSDDKFGIPKSLKEALKAGQVVAFIGAGISMSVKKKNEDGTKSDESLFPSWKEFLHHAADKLDAEKIALNNEGKSKKAIIIRNLLDDEPINYLDTAQRAFDSLGKNYWYDLLAENFEIDIDSAEEKSLELPKLIWQLGNNLLVTTNVDLVLQSVHETSGKVKILDTQAVEFAELQKDWKPTRPTVLHLHGHIDNKADVIFTEEQYQNFYNLDKNRAKIETLRSLFAQRVILFIGFSLDDLFILKELERVRLIYEGGAHSLFIILPECEKNNPNIPKFVEVISYRNYGEPQLLLLRDLSAIAKKTSIDNVSNSQTESQLLLNKTHFNVPFASKGAEFVGRVGMCEEIWEKLNQGGRAAIGQALNIRGLGGLGKTQLAVEYAHRYRDKYKNGVFWLTADEDIDNELAQIGKHLKWINQSDADINQIRISKKNFLKLTDSLIVFDNVDNLIKIKNYLPKDKKSNHILITSREKQVGFRQIKLSLLTPDESRNLLLKVSNRNPDTIEEKEALEDILSQLEGLPLAIELVGGYLNEHEIITFAEYRDFLKNEPLDKLEKKFLGGSFTNHGKSIIRTLRISEKLLMENSLLIKILYDLAWSGSSSMGVSLLQTLVGEKNVFDFKETLSEAHNLRWIKKADKAERYTIHPLFAKVIRFEYKLEDNPKRFESIVNRLTKWADERGDKLKFLNELEEEIEHLEVWQNNAVDLFPENAIRIGLVRVTILKQQGNFQEALNDTNTLIDIYKNKKLNNQELLAELFAWKGLLQRSLGKYTQSLKYKLKGLRIRQKLFGDEHEFKAMSLNSVGVAYSDLGKHKEALEYKLKALEIRQKLFGEKHFKTAESINNVGITLEYLGKYDEALNYKQKALKIREELFGEEHPDTASSYNFVGIAYEDLREYEIALDYKLKALYIRQKLFGEKHSAIANSLNNVGMTYGKLGKHRQALDYKQQALEIRKQLFGEEHPDTARSLNDLGITFRDLRKYELAKKHQLRALETRKKLLGKNHLITATSLANVGYTYYKLNDFQNVVKYLQPVLRIRRKSLGNNHPLTIKIWRELIDALHKAEKFEQAERLANELLKYVPQNHSDKLFFE